MFDIRDYGAIGDGKNKNTAAIQAAVDACAAAGGGRVLVPSGRWLPGSLTFPVASSWRTISSAIIEISC